ncbi:MAG: hypothetical protein AVDCRST_MAG19-2559 [uncultured Thermomicrobiales bacterium]|uniref:DUF3455 domain-containing protein n=1 Tax=uncultured Thermomicrobiales bacterium TaxID=1645740 RepID=A0A6J4V4J2_9BACT|nr:MAG: hypothetical protein AVDCRST_MAG19-2559 [uncultured Thermomicrobiales bacterium]
MPKTGLIVGLAAVSLAGAAGGAMAGSSGAIVLAQATPTAFPIALEVPAGSAILFATEARGVQIYDCAESPDEPGTIAWVFREPEADLFNAAGELVGTHYAGPTWEGNDGSTIVGEVLERADSPASGSIPWLLLEAAENGGTGIFATATHVQRLDTAGGAAPETGCGEENLDDELRVPYTATYAFAYPAADA